MENNQPVLAPIDPTNVAQKKWNKKILLIGIFILLIIALPILLFALQKKQETRSRATASTTLTFSPATTAAKVGDTVSFDITLNPGNNLISYTQLEIRFDPAVLATSAATISPNSSVFPTVLEGPKYTTNSVIISLSIGNDPNKVIQTTTKIATVTFTAIAPTSTASQLTFGPKTQVLSVASSDQPAENVLSSTTPASITVSQALVTLSSTPPMTPTPTPTGTLPTPTSTPSATPIPPTGTGTTLTFTLALQGISDLGGNTNPKHTSKTLSVQVFNASDAQVASSTGTINFDTKTASFSGTISFTTIQTGNYTIKVKTDKYLRKLIPGIQTITEAANTIIPTTLLTVGDANNDNILDIKDYNILSSCFADKATTSSCSDQTSADFNDDGVIDGIDYNYLIRNLTIQSGD